MKTVTAIYTGQALVAPLKEAFQKMYPEHRIVNVLDDSLIASVIEAGGLTGDVLRKLYSLTLDAYLSGTDVILQTCSSVGASVEIIKPFFDIPILRIDQPMSALAVRNYKRIGVLATLPTTLNPTIDLVNAEAEKAGNKVGVSNGLAEGAFEALSSGNSELHDSLIMDTAKKLKDDCDVFLLAQGSMARMAENLEKELAKPVLSSPLTGLESLKQYFEG